MIREITRYTRAPQPRDCGGAFKLQSMFGAAHPRCACGCGTLIGTWVDAVTGSLGTKKGPGLEDLLAFFSTSLHETAVVEDYTKRVPHARQFV